MAGAGAGLPFGMTGWCVGNWKWSSRMAGRESRQRSGAQTFLSVEMQRCCKRRPRAKAGRLPARASGKGAPPQGNAGAERQSGPSLRNPAKPTPQLHRRGRLCSTALARLATCHPRQPFPIPHSPSRHPKWKPRPCASHYSLFTISLHPVPALAFTRGDIN